ncbi:hypothetical protein [Helicobacter sp. T3_23-1059]
MKNKKIVLGAKIFIALFWINGMYFFIDEFIHNQQSAKELFLKHWDIFCVIFLGCISVILDIFYIKRNIAISYFFIVWLSIIAIVFIRILLYGI